MAPKYDDPPFTINLPADMRAKLRRIAAKRGEMPLGVLIREIIADWLARADKRDRKKKTEAQAEAGK